MADPQSSSGAPGSAAAASNTTADPIVHDDEVELDPLDSIWGDGWEKFFGIGNKRKMKCLDCGRVFAENASKAAYHSALVKGGNINICDAVIAPNRLRRFKQFHDGVIAEKVAKERAKAVSDFALNNLKSFQLTL